MNTDIFVFSCIISMLTNFNFLKVLLGLTLYIQQAKNKKKNFDIVSYRTRKRICFIHTVLLENKLERLYKSLYLCLSVSFQSKLFYIKSTLRWQTGDYWKIAHMMELNAKRTYRNYIVYYRKNSYLSGEILLIH